MNSPSIHRQERLRELHEHLGVTQEKFGEPIGLTGGYVSRLLYPAGKKGGKRLGVDVIDKIVEAYGLSRGWFDLPLGTALPQTPIPDDSATVVAHPARSGAGRRESDTRNWPFTLPRRDFDEMLTPEEIAKIDGFITGIAARHQPRRTGSSA